MIEASFIVQHGSDDTSEYINCTVRSFNDTVWHVREGLRRSQKSRGEVYLNKRLFPFQGLEDFKVYLSVTNDSKPAILTCGSATIYLRAYRDLERYKVLALDTSKHKNRWLSLPMIMLFTTQQR